MKKRIFLLLLSILFLLAFNYYPSEGNSLTIISPENYVSQKVGVSKGFERTLTWLDYYEVYVKDNYTITNKNDYMLATQLTYKVVELPVNGSIGKVALEGNLELTRTYEPVNNEYLLQISFYDYIDSYVIYTDWNGWKNYFNVINSLLNTTQNGNNTVSKISISFTLKENTAIINYYVLVTISNSIEYSSFIIYNGENIYDKETGSLVYRNSTTTYKEITSGKLSNYNSRRVVLKDLSYQGFDNDKALPALDFVLIVPSLIIISLLIKRTNILKKK